MKEGNEYLPINLHRALPGPERGINMKTLKVNAKVNADVRKVLDEAFKNAIEKCPNTLSCEEFLARCDSSGEIKISEEPDDILAEEEV